MSFQQLIIILKGSAYSGNYAHAGRPGKIGGSAPGGGHLALGVQRGENATSIKRRAYTRRTVSKFPLGDADRLIAQQNLREKCENYDVDCTTLRDYTSSYHLIVNGYLRGNENYSEEAAKDIAQKVRNIDDVFDQTPPLDKPIRVYRGVSPSVINKLHPGDEFRDDGFVSTSIGSDSAFPGAEVEIRLPAGTRALYLDTISMHTGEQELLIDRSYKYKVLEVKRASYLSPPYDDNPTEDTTYITDMIVELVLE